MASVDPVDVFAMNAAMHVVTECWGARDPEILYPGPRPVPLQRLGEFMGWSSKSLLGLGIHQRYGTWFAYRALFAVDCTLQPTQPGVAPASPCDDCLEQPCRGACPVGAVRADAPFALDACLSYRLRPASPCADRCFARLACPIGSDWRYEEEQMAYHGQRALDSLRKWHSRKPNPN